MKTNKCLGLFQYHGPFSIIFYMALFALLWYLIIPHTSVYYRNDFFDPYFHKLNNEDVTLMKGEVFKVYPVGINKRVYYSSTDFKVADVNIFGNVIAYRPGTAFIKVKVDDEVFKCRVRVISISHKNLELNIGETYKLKVYNVWFGVSWSSSNKAVVKVNRFGKVTAVSKGSATVYGEVRGKVLSCKVKVE